MSVDFYTEPYFKGVKISFDIGTYNKDQLENIIINSMIINDNVQVVIRTKKDKFIFCGQQSKQKIDTIDKILKIDINYSICNPYTDENSILNRYSIGKNYSIQFNKDLKKIDTDSNIKTGFIDFWYNNQINKTNQDYYVNPLNVNSDFYNTSNEYNDAVKNLNNYNLYNKWYNNKKFNNHNQEVIYNHIKDNFPLSNTNNIANCKFDCGRTSDTFQRNLCELKCKPNGFNSTRLRNNKKNEATDCYKDAEQISYGYKNNKDNYKHQGKGISTKIKYVNVPKPEQQMQKPSIPLPKKWDYNIQYLQGFEPNIGKVVENFGYKSNKQCNLNIQIVIFIIVILFFLNK